MPKLTVPKCENTEYNEYQFNGWSNINGKKYYNSDGTPTTDHPTWDQRQDATIKASWTSKSKQ